MSKPKIGTKWSGKTAASILGVVGIINNSDDVVLLTYTNGHYKVTEILSKEEFDERVAEEMGHKVTGKNTTNRKIARELQNQYNKQSNARATKKSISAAKSPYTASTRRRPKAAPVTPSIAPRKRPQVAPKRENSLERNLRLVAESQTSTDVVANTSLHNNDMSKVVAKMTVAELKVALSTRGLSIKGLKQELVKRLLKAIKENA